MVLEEPLAPLEFPGILGEQQVQRVHWGPKARRDRKAIRVGPQVLPVASVRKDLKVIQEELQALQALKVIREEPQAPQDPRAQPGPQAHKVPLV